MNTSEGFDTILLKDFLDKIHEKTRNEITQIKKTLRQHELEIYNKWKVLYKKCNPVDYLVNSSETSRKTLCLQDCYRNIDKFSRFMERNYHTFIDMLSMYDCYMSRLKAAEHDVSTTQRRINVIELNISKATYKLKNYVTSFMSGILYVTPSRLYKLNDFVRVFTGKSLKLPTVNIKDTLDSLTIYVTKNKSNSTERRNNEKNGLGVNEVVCHTRSCNRTGDELVCNSNILQTTTQPQRHNDSQPMTVIKDNEISCQNGVCRRPNEYSLVDDTLDSDSMSIDSADSWFEDELKVSDDTVDMGNSAFRVSHDPELSTDKSSFHRLHADEEPEDVPLSPEIVYRYNEIVYEKLQTPDYDIIHDVDIKNYVSMIRKYLRNLYHERSIPENTRGLQVSLPEYLRKTFKAIPVCGNGSCFYGALSIQIIGDESLSGVLRVLLVYHMKINKLWIIHNFYINISADKTFDDLIQESLSSNEYIDGGYPPVIMSIILDRPINIYGYEKNTFMRINSWVFQSLKNHRANQLSEFFLYLHENHYTALVLLKNDTSNIPPLEDYKVDVFSTFTLV